MNLDPHKRCWRCDDDLDPLRDRLGGLCAQCLNTVRIITKPEWDVMMGRSKGTILGGD